MHIHLPKSLHGWKEFANEIFVIVIGVLIALGFEQVVEEVHWMHKVEDGEDRLAQELKGNYLNAAKNIVYTPCVLTQLDRIRDKLLDPASPPLPVDRFGDNDAVLRTPTGAMQTQTWDALRNDGTLLHMDAEHQGRLNRIYDTMSAHSADSLEAGRFSGRLLAASFTGRMPDALRAQLLLELAEQYRRTQILTQRSAAIMLSLQDLGYAATDAEVDASLVPEASPTFRTPFYCRANGLPVSDWRTVLQKYRPMTRKN